MNFKRIIPLLFKLKLELGATSFYKILIIVIGSIFTGYVSAFSFNLLNKNESISPFVLYQMLLLVLVVWHIGNLILYPTTSTFFNYKILRENKLKCLFLNFLWSQVNFFNISVFMMGITTLVFLVDFQFWHLLIFTAIQLLLTIINFCVRKIVNIRGVKKDEKVRLNTPLIIIKSFYENKHFKINLLIFLSVSLIGILYLSFSKKVQPFYHFYAFLLLVPTTMFTYIFNNIIAYNIHLYRLLITNKKRKEIVLIYLAVAFFVALICFLVSVISLLPHYILPGIFPTKIFPLDIDFFVLFWSLFFFNYFIGLHFSFSKYLKIKQNMRGTNSHIISILVVLFLNSCIYVLYVTNKYFLYGALLIYAVGSVFLLSRFLKCNKNFILQNYLK